MASVSCFVVLGILVSLSGVWTTCVDLVNPATGVSDCYKNVYRCNDPDPIWRDFMTQQCPRTCNRCQSEPSVPVSNGECFDKINPSTGRSDCPQMVVYCTDAVYYDTMTEQCPKTCNRCPPVVKTTSKPTTKATQKSTTKKPTVPATQCVDTHPSCAEMKSNGFCKPSPYYTTAEQAASCAKTCNLC